MNSLHSARGQSRFASSISLMKTFILLATLVLCGNAFASTYRCVNIGNSELPATIEYYKPFLRSVATVSVSYERRGRTKTEVIPCLINEGTVICRANNMSPISSVSFQRQGPVYKLKGLEQVTQYLTCERTHLFW